MDGNYIIENLNLTHIEEICDIEKRCFSDAWSRQSFIDEIDNENSVFIVVKKEDKIVAYSGFWYIVDDAQIMNVAVDIAYKGMKISHILMKEMIQRAMDKNMATMSLEVRVSNEIAINLYKVYGFEIVGVRKQYYQDNKEDAYIMFTSKIKSRIL